MLSLHRLCERSQRGGSAIVAAWALGHRDHEPAVRKLAVDKSRLLDQCTLLGQIHFQRTVSRILNLIRYILTKLVRRRFEIGDNDEHGTTNACTGCWDATIRCTSWPSHGDGTPFESWRPRRRTATGCGDGPADASRRTSSQSSRADDGKYSTRYRRARTGGSWSWRAKCACPLTSKPWSGATDVCAATATSTSSDGTST